MRETELYPPVKAFLEAQGYAVKGEVESCDLVAVRGDEAPVIVELKTSFTLGLVFQGIARQSVTDNVYPDVPPFSERTTRRKDAIALCRRLGLGLLTVRLESKPFVEALLDPAQFRPRRSKARLGRLLREFEHRVGDSNEGGAARRKVMTAYRQDALRCAVYLSLHGPTKAATGASDTGVARARAMMSPITTVGSSGRREPPAGAMGLHQRVERRSMSTRTSCRTSSLSGGGAEDGRGTCHSLS